MIAEAIASVKPRSIQMRTLQRMLRALEHSDVRTAKFGCIKRVATGLVDIHVACDGGDGHNLNLRRAQRHDQRDGVVGGGIGVNQKWTFHAWQDSKLIRGWEFGRG